MKEISIIGLLLGELFFWRRLRRCCSLMRPNCRAVVVLSVIWKSSLGFA